MGIAVATTKFTLEPWMIINEGLTKIDDDITWYWSPPYKIEGVYSGMYVKYEEKYHGV